MKEKHTLIVVLVLLGLVIYYSFFENYASLKERERRPGPLIFELSPMEIKRIEIKRLDGGELIGERNQMRRWVLVKGNRAEQWESKVDDFIFNLLMLVEIDKFRVENSQLKNFGLENPGLRITLTDITDKTYQILIGNSNPVRTSLYVKFVESPNVIITGAILNYELQKLNSLFTPEH